MNPANRFPYTHITKQGFAYTPGVCDKCGRATAGVSFGRVLSGGRPAHIVVTDAAPYAEEFPEGGCTECTVEG